jgi:hypothetical protein
MAHIERKSELHRRRKRREKVRHLKAKLAAAKTPGEVAALMQKIRHISPFCQLQTK